MNYNNLPFKSHYGSCLDHGTEFDQDSLYILVTVISTDEDAPEKGVVQFQACNDNCASNHLFHWLNKECYSVSFQYSTPASREETARRLEEERKVLTHA